MGRVPLDLVVPILVGLFAIAAILVVAWRRRAGSRPKVAPVVPSPRVRILKSREELEEAVRRAAAFERSSAEVLEQRAEHYEALLAGPASITEIPRSPVQPPTAADGEQARSA